MRREISTRRNAPTNTPSARNASKCTPAWGSMVDGLQERDPEAVAVTRWSRRSSSCPRNTAGSCSWSVRSPRRPESIRSASSTRSRIYPTRRSSSSPSGRGARRRWSRTRSPTHRKPLLAAPKVTAVRGYSMFGMSFIYVLFDEGTDVYWARSRVLEYMSGISRSSRRRRARDRPGRHGDRLGLRVRARGQDRAARSRRAPDASGLHAALRARERPGVAQVASVGGYERQYQVTLDPESSGRTGSASSEVAEAVRKSNGEVGGRVLEMSGREYFVRGRGYLENLAGLAPRRQSGRQRTPVRVSDVATVRFGGDIRRGLAELDGKGETVGAIVMARFGENPTTSLTGSRPSWTTSAGRSPPAWRSSPPMTAPRSSSEPSRPSTRSSRNDRRRAWSSSSSCCTCAAPRSRSWSAPGGRARLHPHVPLRGTRDDHESGRHRHRHRRHGRRRDRHDRGLPQEARAGAAKLCTSERRSCSTRRRRRSRPRSSSRS